MDVGNNRRFHRILHSVCFRHVFVIFLLVPNFSAAAERIVVIGEEDNSIHSRFMDGFERQLQAYTAAVPVKFVSREKINNDRDSISDATLLVTIGTMTAKELLVSGIAVPTINALVSEGFLGDGRESHGVSGETSSIYVDQPPLRMLSLVKAALPGSGTITIAVGESSQRFGDEIKAACDTLHLACEHMLVKDSAGIEDALEVAAYSGRVLMVLPDPLVINASTAKTLILGAYLRRISLVGFSHALVKAGALMAVYSTPEQLGMDAANMANDALSNHPVHLPQSRYPTLFSVAVNYQLARALELDLPSEDTLKQMIKKAETDE